MTDHHQEILHGKDACVPVGHLIGASGTGDVAGLALTERTGRVGASTYVKELEPGPALLGQHMTNADPFQQLLSFEMGEI